MAATLVNLGLARARAGRHAEVEPLFVEAVEIYRRVVVSRPLPYLNYLATTVRNLAIVLASLDRPREAAAAREEAMRVQLEAEALA